MLIIFGGLPGTDKSTIARLLALSLNSVWLRIDSIEQSLVQSEKITISDMGPAGYVVAYAIAADNIRLGNTVIADSVNHLAITRQSWRNVALENAVPALEIEIICSNKAQHQERVEPRLADIPGHVLPDWQKVINRQYEDWLSTDLTLDTSALTPEQAVEVIPQHIKSRRR
ncbi:MULTISPECIES: AAA family ATPase [Symbiopectobacterium]|uniref:AAA family ATPase n=1 Tax=Symbiopectobacterium TaxID=801 RepID=UPI001A18313B|nr:MULTISPECIES: AAA family ATPase [Symbiopectobacterium]MBG6248708.1 adenylyl-sulfate kinase [Candidatus Symbiopectobacterium sp. PLON1]MBT9428752.1 AAA family ATPase [Candidatus Symbiopectobacterium endolongispinus]